MAKAHIKHGDEEQRRRAVEALARSCEQGASLTCEDLGNLLETTEPERATVFKRQAVTLWTAGCDRGDASDCMSSARAYGEGRLVERDAELEKRFAARACELGHFLCKMME